MGEEAQYTAGLTEYQKKSRFPTLSRYRDLIEFVKAAFIDGEITATELGRISHASDAILLEYQTAVSIYYELPEGDPRKSAAWALVSHLHRCNVFMSFAKTQAKMRNSKENEKRPRPVLTEHVELGNQKVLKIAMTSEQLQLLQDLQTTRQRVDAELPRIRRDLSHLSAEERAEYEAQINGILDHILRSNLENITTSEWNRLIGLEKYLTEEKERVRES